LRVSIARCWQVCNASRVAGLDGELVIDGPVGNGTRVTARVPSSEAVK